MFYKHMHVHLQAQQHAQLCSVLVLKVMNNNPLI